MRYNTVQSKLRIINGTQRQKSACEFSSSMELQGALEKNVAKKVKMLHIDMRMSDPLSGTHFPWASVKIGFFFLSILQSNDQ